MYAFVISFACCTQHEPVEPLVLTATVGTPILCFGEQARISFQCPTGGPCVVFGNSEEVLLYAGDYNWNATNSFGCFANFSFDIGEPGIFFYIFLL